MQIFDNAVKGKCIECDQTFDETADPDFALTDSQVLEIFMAARGAGWIGETQFEEITRKGYYSRALISLLWKMLGI